MVKQVGGFENAFSVWVQLEIGDEPRVVGWGALQFGGFGVNAVV
jgi:hypothetical protein